MIDDGDDDDLLGFVLSLATSRAALKWTANGTSPDKAFFKAAIISAQYLSRSRLIEPQFMQKSDTPCPRQTVLLNNFTQENCRCVTDSV